MTLRAWVEWRGRESKPLGKTGENHVHRIQLWYGIVEVVGKIKTSRSKVVAHCRPPPALHPSRTNVDWGLVEYHGSGSLEQIFLTLFQNWQKTQQKHENGIRPPNLA